MRTYFKDTNRYNIIRFNIFVSSPALEGGGVKTANCKATADAGYDAPLGI